jgi:hypothetical protein|tara:strand:- start:29 stop:358 length:330 start_codon:yes stop_codon:yes gene_type:complete
LELQLQEREEQERSKRTTTVNNNKISGRGRDISNLPAWMTDKTSEQHGQVAEQRVLCHLPNDSLEEMVEQHVVGPSPSNRSTKGIVPMPTLPPWMKEDSKRIYNYLKER